MWRWMVRFDWSSFVGLNWRGWRWMVRLDWMMWRIDWRMFVKVVRLTESRSLSLSDIGNITVIPA